VTTQAGGYVSAGTSSMVNDLTNLQYFLLRLSNFAPPP
jgi:hypothetical protein